ncbi:MAG: AzlD domain-containing protein [Planctomycetales bacterium]|nr:AzlD domain-containing protein [bacterium]UNM09567.1 MAG: AzlD domain-containing protein [Planctomycetales bacterium]
MQPELLQFATVTLCVGAGTLALRSAFILPGSAARLPEGFRRALAFVPAAVFAGLLVASLHPERVIHPGDPVQLRLPAMLIATLVALRTKSILWTILSGMGSLWLLSWLATLL